MNASPPEITVVAALLLHGGRFLIARRPADDPLGPVWEFPGGKVEAGECHAAALARALEEELGIRAEVGDEVERVRHAYPHLVVNLHFLRVRDYEGEVEGLDGQEFDWVAPDRLAERELPAADARLVAALPELARRWSAES